MHPNNLTPPPPPTLLAFILGIWQVDSGDLIGQGDRTYSGNTGMRTQSLSLCLCLSFCLLSLSSPLPRSHLKCCHLLRVGVGLWDWRRFLPPRLQLNTSSFFSLIDERAPLMALGTNPTNNKMLLSFPICHHPLWMSLPWEEARMAGSEFVLGFKDQNLVMNSWTSHLSGFKPRAGDVQN